MSSTYDTFMLYSRNQARTYQRVAADPVEARAEDYYRANIGKITNVDDFIKDQRLFSYAMKAFGLQDMTYAKALMKKVLTSDLSDPKSVANKFNDVRYRTFAAAFQFDTTGALKNKAAVQTTDQSNDTVTRYQAATKGQVLSPVETLFVQQTLAKVDSVDSLLGNARLLKDVLTAYGVSADTSNATLKSALTSDTSDPKSFINQQKDQNLKALAADFNFDQSGKPTTERVAQSSDSFLGMAKLYAQQVKFDTALNANVDTETSYVQKRVLAAHNVDDLVNDARTVKFIGTAFGDKSLDATTLRSILTSDLEDPKSKANTLGPQYRKIAAFFQFTTAGLIERDAPKAAQNQSNIETTILSYMQNAVESEAGDNSPGAQLALYFVRKAPNITSPFELLGDKALWKFTQTALNLPASIGDNIDQVAATIKSRLNGMADLRDPKKITAMVSRFAALYDMQSGSQAQDPILRLFTTG